MHIGELFAPIPSRHFHYDIIVIPKLRGHSSPIIWIKTITCPPFLLFTVSVFLPTFPQLYRYIYFLKKSSSSPVTSLLTVIIDGVYELHQHLAELVVFCKLQGSNIFCMQCSIALCVIIATFTWFKMPQFLLILKLKCNNIAWTNPLCNSPPEYLWAQQPSFVTKAPKPCLGCLATSQKVHSHTYYM